MPATITSTWDAHFILHYLLLRCLWEGRVGNDTLVKVTLKKLYLLMDDTSDRGVFSEVRAKGGAIEVNGFSRSLAVLIKGKDSTSWPQHDGQRPTPTCSGHTAQRHLSSYLPRHARLEAGLHGHQLHL